MADRFPSLDDIDAGQTTTRNTNGAEDADDFLARERAALGEDAGMFTTSNDRSAQVAEDDNDLLGDDFGAPQSSSQPHGGAVTGGDLDDFETSFPAVVQDNNIPGGSITNTSVNYNSGYQTHLSTDTDELEPEPIRQWREKRNADLSRRDQVSSEKKSSTIETARKDIDSFYESYNRKVDKGKEQTKKEADDFLAKREDTTSGGTSWERIAKMTEVHSAKGAGGLGVGKTRMRELLVSLSRDKDAPGASGV